MNTLILLLSLASPALAADAFPGPIVTFLPAGDVIGDGATEVTVNLLALTAAGDGIVGLPLELGATGATVSGWTEVGRGLYAVTLEPDSTTLPGLIVIEAKGKNEAKQKIKVTGSVAVRPPRRGGVTLSADPSTLLLGEDSESTVTIQLGGSLGDLDPSRLAIRTSVGEVVNATGLGGGRISAKLRVTDVKLRQLAMITVSDKGDPGRVYGSLAVPLIGQVQQKVKSAPKSTVLVKLGGREFGPVQTDRAGWATVPIQVPPGPTTAALVAVSDGGTVETSLDLKLAETGRVWLVPPHPGIPADADVPIPVRVVVFTPDGERDAQATVHLEVSAGAVTSPTHEGDGIYVAEFSPPVLNEAAKVAITASLEGTKLHRDTVTVDLSPVRPRGIELASDPARLGAATTNLVVTATVRGPGGAPLSSRRVELAPTGARVEGELKDNKDGTYTANLVRRGKGTVDVTTRVATPPTGNPVRRLVVFPSRDAVPADGLTPVLLTVVTIDEFGYPVSGVPVKLAVASGQGSLPAQATTDAFGMAQVAYTAGRTPGLIELRMSIEGDTEALAILQGPVGMNLPVSGTADAGALRQAWEAAVAQLRVPME